MESLVLVASLALSIVTAVPEVDIFDARRFADDLAISWQPDAISVDGYRVYRSRDIGCGAPELVLEGDQSVLSYGDINAMLDPMPALYRVAAFIGNEEGPRGTPIYKYPVDFPSSLPRVLSFPVTMVTRVGMGLSDEDLCTELNESGPVARFVSRWNGIASVFITHQCGSPIRNFFLYPYEAYGVSPASAGVSAMIWGYGRATPFPDTPDWTVNLVAASSVLAGLPYDHAYSTLAAVAADIPEALEVSTFDPTANPPFVGLSRANTGDPWTGTDLPLDGARRPEGLRIAVATDTIWLPRRLCGAPCTPLPRISTLWATKSGGDVHLEWTPNGSALGGYGIYTVSNDPSAIPRVLDNNPPPYLSVPQTYPPFPIVDANAAGGSAGTCLFYQVVSRCADGTPGGL